MSDNIIIRKANLGDLEEIIKLIDSPVADNGEAMSLQEARPVLDSILDDPNYFQIVATSEKGLVGIVTLVIIMQLTHQGSTTAVITDLVVSPEEDDAPQSIASSLLEYTSNLASEYGCYKTIMHTDFQTDMAISACKEMGFEESGPSYHLPES